MEQYFILPKSLIPDPNKLQDYPNQPQRSVFITGITGQDGLYLTSFLLFKQTKYNYVVHGLIRKNSATLPILYELMEYLDKNGCRQKQLVLHTGDITDSLFIFNTLERIKPDEIYNFAAQSHVQLSFQMVHHTIDVNFYGLINICQSVINLKLKPKIFQACTSEMFGMIDNDLIKKEILMDENFPFNPASPYAVSKISTFYLVKYYRNVYNLEICTAFSFNHESPLRHELFITRKVTKGLARIKYGLQATIKVGNLYAIRDWGHTGDYVRGFWLMLNSQPNKTFQDYVIATEMSISVKDFIIKVFTLAGYDVQYTGDGVDEKLVDRKTRRVYVEIDPQFFRPGEVPFLKGNYKKIEKDLGWRPEFSIDELIKEMIDYDQILANQEQQIKHRQKL